MIIIYYLVRGYELVLLARIILSWIHPLPYHPIIKAIYAVTDVVMNPVRRILPIQAVGIDFSPIVIFAVLEFLIQFLSSMV